MLIDSSVWDKTICPYCGVVKSPKSLGKHHTCKECGYEGVYTIRKILKHKWDEPIWDDVSLQLFLERLQLLGLLEDIE